MKNTHVCSERRPQWHHMTQPQCSVLAATPHAQYLLILNWDFIVKHSETFYFAKFLWFSHIHLYDISSWPTAKEAGVRQVWLSVPDLYIKKQEDCCNFKDNMIQKVNSKPASATQRDPASAHTHTDAYIWMHACREGEGWKESVYEEQFSEFCLCCMSLTSCQDSATLKPML